MSTVTRHLCLGDDFFPYVFWFSRWWLRQYGVLRWDSPTPGTSMPGLASGVLRALLKSGRLGGLGIAAVEVISPKEIIQSTPVEIFFGDKWMPNAVAAIATEGILYLCTVDEVLMAKKQKQQAYEVTPTDRLGMRVSAMINSPKAQDLGRVTIHRLDTDPAEAWDAVMEVLVETDGIDLVFNDDGTVTLRWDRQELEG
ncbi:DUF1654 domain-containing protein [Pseudomonas aeruginosa]|uniref:DUF1654 domain-containing protein n=1 Tax=Pseudomonas aeruginosa TaxID=287 RepID=UPI001CD3D816|nr:DUF1654 domain-containing protein [Pseudomonas aeruginosa]